MGYSTLTRPVDSSIQLIFLFYLATSIVGKLKRQHRCLGQSSGRSLMVDRFFSCVCFDSNVLVVLVDFLDFWWVQDLAKSCMSIPKSRILVLSTIIWSQGGPNYTFPRV